MSLRLSDSKAQRNTQNVFPKVLFMETKNNRNALLYLQKWSGYDRVYTVEPRGLSGGLALFWKKTVHMELLYVDKNVMDCHIRFGSFSYFVTCVYGDPFLKYRHKMWERINRIGISRKGSWCILGDFNELLHNGEKLGDPARPA